MVHILVTIDPSDKLKVHREAILHLMRLLLEREISENAFLRECGISISPNPGLSLEFAPIAGLRIEETSVAHLLRRILELRIDENEFLSACGIQLTVEDTAEYGDRIHWEGNSQWDHYLNC